MVNNLRDRIKEAAESEDYVRMEEEYANLTSWIDDTDAALDKMISLGVIKKNGKLDNDSVLKKMKNDKIVYQNLSALFNFRYEMIFKVASQLYYSNPGISYDQMRVAVHEHFGESNQNRFSYDVKAAWSALH